MTNINLLTKEASAEMAIEIMNVIKDLKLIQSSLDLIKHPKEISESDNFDELEELQSSVNDES